MDTLVVKADEIDKIVHAIKHEQVVAFPTETVYGLGIIYDSKKAIDRLIKAKNRDMSKHFTMMLASTEDIEKYAIVSERDKKIIQHFMPGDLTIVLNNRNKTGTVGIRIPDDEFVCEVIRRVGKPIYVTSANISHQPSTTLVEEVISQLNGRIPYIVAGNCGNGIASSVVDLTGENIIVLRQGRITIEMIRRRYDENSNGM